MSCSYPDCNFERYENKDKCIFHHDKQDWLTPKTKQWKKNAEEKIKLFWSEIRRLRRQINNRYDGFVFPMFEKFTAEIKIISENNGRIGVNDYRYIDNIFFGYRNNYQGYYYSYLPRGASFKNTIFMDLADFSKIFFDVNNYGGISFENAVFKNGVSFSHATLMKIDFTSAKFYQNLILDNFSCNNCDFSETKFYNDASFIDSNFYGNIYFSNANFAEKANFTNGVFGGNIDFSEATFENDAIFTQREFKGDADFKGVKIKGKALFDVRGIQGEANFSKAVFEKESTFKDVKVVGDANFSHATLIGEADFQGGSFGGTDFSEATFEEDVVFTQREFKGKANFENGIFEKNADFSETTFENDAIFTQREFKGDADFKGVKITGKALFDVRGIQGEANFSKAVFEKESTFKDVKVVGDANFSHATLIGEADFQGGSFGGTDFSEATFEEDVVFTQREFKGKANFENGIFEKNADFSETTFENDAIFTQREFKGDADFKGVKITGKALFNVNGIQGDADFAMAEFKDESTFKDVEITGDVTFSHATLEGKANFENGVFGANTNFSESKFKSNAIFTQREFRGKTNFKNGMFEKNADFSESTFEDDAIFTQREFKGDADFKDVKVVGDVNFSHGTLIGKSDFQGGFFGGNADFSGRTFKNDAIFTEREFRGSANFSDVKSEDICLAKTKFKLHGRQNESINELKFSDGGEFGFIDLTDSTLEQAFTVQNSNFRGIKLSEFKIRHVAEIKFRNIKVDTLIIDNYVNEAEKVLFDFVTVNKELEIKHVSFDKERFNHFDMSGAYVEIENSAFNDNFFNSVKWGTISEKRFKASGDIFRQLKYHSEKQKNFIDADGFYSLEMKEQKKELHKENKKISSVWEKISHFFTNTLIFHLHEKTSNFSQNWLLPIFWLFIVGMAGIIFKADKLIIDIPFLLFYLTTISVSYFAYKSLSPQKKIPNFAIYISIFLPIAWTYFQISESYFDDIAKLLNPSNIFKPVTLDKKHAFTSLLYKVVVLFLVYQVIISIKKKVRSK